MLEKPMYHRTQIAIGEELQEKIVGLHILICGIGGVGSYVLEALARVGVGAITIVDKDVIDETNLNRQLIALCSTIGKAKVEVAKERVQDINPDCVVRTLQSNITPDTIDTIIQKQFDYVVDAVDNLDAKVAIIRKCHQENILCISSMGMANKVNPKLIEIADITKTHTCPLAKIIRKRLKEEGIYKQKVVFSSEIVAKRTEQQREKYGNVLGSVSFVPSVAGLLIASEVIKDISSK